ncbi:MAG: hypothetical protein WDO73_15915 [Ignavibacteriota bacterium]
MKRALFLSLLMLPALAARPSDDWREEDRETIHKTFRVAAGENVAKLISDQINGPIRITGGSGTEIRIDIEKRNRAEMRSDLDAAKREVKLEMTQEGNTVRLYEDGPWRHDDGWRHRHYSVVFECDIQVPSGVALDLRTMNGSVEVRNVTGDYKVHTMNGKVEMDEIGGTGPVETMKRQRARSVQSKTPQGNRRSTP